MAPEQQYLFPHPWDQLSGPTQISPRMLCSTATDSSSFNMLEGWLDKNNSQQPTFIILSTGSEGSAFMFIFAYKSH